MFYMSQPFYLDNTRVAGVWGLCRLDHEWRYEEFLTEREKVEYAALKAENRKREWLSARVTLKKILMDGKIIESPTHCQTEKDRFGCPRVRVRKEDISMIMNCSISHKKGVACVCISCFPEMRLGIDMESITERPWRVRRAFINRCDLLEGVREVKKNYTILWACKEAASKVIGLGMLMDFRKLTIRGDKRRRFTVFEDRKETMQGCYFFSRDFIVAICYRGFGI